MGRTMKSPGNTLKIHEEHWESKEETKFDEMTYENSPYHDYFRALPFLAIRNHFNLNNQSILIAGCGTGIDIHYLLKYFKNIQCYASDIAPAAVDLVKRTFNIDGSVQNNERLSFDDNAFDYSFIAASLHHLQRPHLGLYELLRVSKKGIIVIEPNDSWLTRLAVNLGLATEYEKECKNYVFRYNKREVQKIAKAMFCNCKIIRLFAIHRQARSQGAFCFLKAINQTCNRLFPSLGNYIIFSIIKENAP
jgi:ubiquinone/menaquinone biosynthesis C-methylase UbiE